MIPEQRIKIKKVDKRSNFLHIIAELDGEFYEGILITKWKMKEDEEKEKERNEKRT